MLGVCKAGTRRWRKPSSPGPRSASAPSPASSASRRSTCATTSSPSPSSPSLYGGPSRRGFPCARPTGSTASSSGGGSPSRTSWVRTSRASSRSSPPGGGGPLVPRLALPPGALGGGPPHGGGPGPGPALHQGGGAGGGPHGGAGDRGGGGLRPGTQGLGRGHRPQGAKGGAGRHPGPPQALPGGGLPGGPPPPTFQTWPQEEGHREEAEERYGEYIRHISSFLDLCRPALAPGGKLVLVARPRRVLAPRDLEAGQDFFLAPLERALAEADFRPRRYHLAVSQDGRQDWHLFVGESGEGGGR